MVPGNLEPKVRYPYFGNVKTFHFRAVSDGIRDRIIIKLEVIKTEAEAAAEQPKVRAKCKIFVLKEGVLLLVRRSGSGSCVVPVWFLRNATTRRCGVLVVH